MIAVRYLFVASLASASLGAGSSAAQEPPPEPRRRVLLRSDTADRLIRRFQLVTQRRARLGVTIDTRPGPNDSIGATIQSVTPGGPAAKAGIKSGDIIVRLDGKSLVGAAAEGRRAGEDESLPGIRLVEIASQLKPDATISVEYRRDGTRHTTSLVTGDEPILAFELPEGAFRFEAPRIEYERVPGGFALGTGRGGFSFELGGPLMDLQLASLNPDLGQYFGTTEGVLVINVPKESSLGLKPGDVVLSVDGRKATGPSSLLRILRSYEPGDSFKLEIMRNKGRMTVTGQVEKHREE